MTSSLTSDDDDVDDDDDNVSLLLDAVTVKTTHDTTKTYPQQQEVDIILIFLVKQC
jgi:hypothetical protein